MYLKPHCAPERQRLVGARQRCVREGCGRQARGNCDVFAEALQPHAALPARELHPHLMLVCKACDTDDVTHAADQRMLDPAQGSRQ